MSRRDRLRRRAMIIRIVAKQRYLAEREVARQRYLMGVEELLKDEPPGEYLVYDNLSERPLLVEKPGTLH